ncbi:hypothetical protein CPB83DRAFT_365577 [Crepidotus variabilis]|uniref:Uncharacterized protein n=1 Tax=Crepidotus variabilis TaxID=179855 RepID=A0A9P6EFK4_9AGAR|nr:hypothetical protein CPB83DRAFT_365577 [Crepidotus variabilis]
MTVTAGMSDSFIKKKSFGLLYFDQVATPSMDLLIFYGLTIFHPIPITRAQMTSRPYRCDSASEVCLTGVMVYVRLLDKISTLP